VSCNKLLKSYKCLKHKTKLTLSVLQQSFGREMGSYNTFVAITLHSITNLEMMGLFQYNNMNEFYRNVQQQCVRGLSPWSHGPWTVRPQSCYKNSHINNIISKTFNIEQYSHFSLLFYSNIVMYSWRLISKFI